MDAARSKFHIALVVLQNLDIKEQKRPTETQSGTRSGGESTENKAPLENHAETKGTNTETQSSIGEGKKRMAVTEVPVVGPKRQPNTIRPRTGFCMVFL